MPKLDVADVAAIACELLDVAPADLLDVLDVEGVLEILSSPAAGAAVPHEAAAGLLHGFLAHPPVPRLERRLALLVAVHLLARSGLDVDLEPGEETRKHLQDVAIGAATLEETIAWLDPRVTASGQHELEGEMLERFSPAGRRVMVLAREESRLLDHGVVGTEHLLLGLLHDGDGPAATALAASGISLHAVRREVAAMPAPPRPASGGAPTFTARAKKVLELALRESLQRGGRQIGPAHLLLGLLREGGGVAVRVLPALGADPAGLREAVLQEVREDAPVADEAQVDTRAPQPLLDFKASLARRAPQHQMTREEELRLARLVEAGRTAREVLEQAGDDLEPHRQRLRDQQDEGDEARSTLVESNLHLTEWIALRYQSSGVPMLELIEAGNVGLERAVEAFDWRKGYSFRGYASWWIRHAITSRVRGEEGPTGAHPPAASGPGAPPSPDGTS